MYQRGYYRYTGTYNKGSGAGSLLFLLVLSIKTRKQEA